MAVSFRDLPIKRKLMLVTVISTGFSLLVVCVALIAYERMTFRRNLVRSTETLAQLIGANSNAALMFNNQRDAIEVLNALSVEDQIVAAALYDKKNELFAQYRSTAETREVPANPGPLGHVFSSSRLGMFRAVLDDDERRVGTIYLRADLDPMYARFWFYGVLVVAVGGCSALGALALSTFLQRRIAAPILELAGVARGVSDRNDYGVRARKYGNDELGALTDDFNHMLGSIEESRTALEASEERLRLALEGSKMGTWDANLVTGALVWDDYMFPLLGISKEQFDGTGRSGLEAVHPDDRENIDRQMLQAVQGGGDYHVDFRVVGPDGAIRSMSSRGRVFFDAAGKAVRMSGVTMDVTADRQTEAALQAAKEAAEAANQAKDGFLAILSHELRTPLTPVLAAVAMIEEDTSLPEHVLQDIGMIRRNVEVEARLIDDLLDVTRVARGKLELKRHVVNARPLLEHALENYCAPEAARRKIDIFKEITASKSHVLADPSRLTQVFWNLLQNACKFTARGGSLSIRMFNENAGPGVEPDLVIEVQDDGIGIDPKVLPRIFDAFEQGERSRTRLFGGLGLGLAISRALVELHGGTLSARSGGKDRGATFTIRLHTVRPSDESATHAATAADSAESSLASERALRVLLIEDHPDTAAQLSRLLQRSRHRVTWAGSLGEARAIVTDSEAQGNGVGFDLVISDLGLPDGSGHELMRELSSRYQLPAIALSGYGMESDIRESMEAGFARHLTKPIDWHELKFTIGELFQDAPEVT